MGEPSHRGRRRVRHIADLRGNQRGAGSDCRRVEQDRNREIHPIRLLDHRKQPDRDQRMTAEVKEAVLDPHLRHPQQILPEPDQRALHVVARRDIVGVKIGPLERLPLHPRRFGFSRLRDQCRQVERRHDDLRHPRRHRTRKGKCTLFRPDAQRERMQQPVLGRRSRPRRTFVIFQPAQIGRKGQRSLHPADGKACDFRHDPAIRLGERDVETRRRLIRAVVGGVADP